MFGEGLLGFLLMTAAMAIVIPLAIALLIVFVVRGHARSVAKEAERDLPS